MAEAMRQGADGLLDEDGVLHRMAVMTVETPKATEEQEHSSDVGTDEMAARPDGPPGEDEPILSADELKALLAEQPSADSDSDAT